MGRAEQNLNALISAHTAELALQSAIAELKRIKRRMVELNWPKCQADRLITVNRWSVRRACKDLRWARQHGRYFPGCGVEDAA
jgi:hypothetical protein